MSGWGNAYDLLGEDDSSSGAVVAVPVKPVAIAKPKEEQKPVRKNEAADNRDARPAKVDSRQQNERRAPRERREEHAEGSDNKSSQQVGEGSPHGERQFRPRNERGSGAYERRERRPEGGAGGGSLGRGAGGAGGAARGPRTYDRHSGTGRGREDKRGGGGRGNWGTQTDEQNAQTTDVVNDEEAGSQWGKPAVEANGDWNAPASSDWAAQPAGDGEQPAGDAPAAAKEVREPVAPTAEELAERAEREKEARQMTLPEYEAKRKQLELALPPTRQAGEGEDPKQWEKFMPARSSKLDTDKPTKEAGSKENKKKAQSELQRQQAADILRFKGEAQRRSAERREGRGGFDGGREGRGGGERPAYQQDARPRSAQRTGGPNKTAELLTPADFPALNAEVKV